MKEQRWSISYGPFFTLIRNILAVYICFMVCRVAFMCQNWNLYADTLTPQLLRSMLIGSLKFDTAGIAYLCTLYAFLASLPLHFKENETYYRIMKCLLIMFVMAGIIMNLADAVYYKYSGSRTTIAIFSEFRNENNIGRIILTETLHSWYLVLLGLALMIFLLWQIRIPQIHRFSSLKVYYVTKTLTLILVMTLSIVGMRGGLTYSRPITMSNANQYVERPAEAAAILNTPFCFIRTLGKKPMSVPQYYSEDELNSRFKAVIMPDSSATAREKNVVIFILEGFSSEYIGFINSNIPGFRSCTPFIDSLMSEGLTFQYTFANGKKSIDAMPSILSGIPMMVENFVLIPASVNEVSGLPGELAGKGYYSAFFHGAENFSMGFLSYSHKIGFQSYFGMDEFNAEPKFGGQSMYDGYWGIWDEEFLQFFCDKMNSFTQPFVTSVFTVTSHHPYSIPERYEKIFPKESASMHRCIRYTDYSIRRFFESAEKQDWYKNTLFVFTADHTNSSGLAEYQNDLGLFRTPIFFYDPSGELKGHRNCIAQQIDIEPTILGYLGYDRPIIGFGQNLFNTTDDDTYAVNYTNGIFQYEKDKYLLQFDGEKVTGMYNYSTDIFLKNNIKDSLPELQDRYEAELKAIIQQYMEHMHSKPLTVAAYH